MSSAPFKLHIGIPTYGLPKSEFAIDSVGEMLYTIGRKHPEIENIVIHRDVRTYRQEARRNIVEEALKDGSTHLLMLDDDHLFTGEIFTKIWLELLRRDAMMLSALYFTRGLPTAPCIFKMTARGTVPIFAYPKNEVVKVDVTGFGFVLFNMDVFRKVNPPWFNLGFGFGEDAAFCARLAHIGIPVLVHTGCVIGHLLEQAQVITEETYEQYRDSWAQQGAMGESSLVPAEFIGTLDPGQQPTWRIPAWRPRADRITRPSSGSACPAPQGAAGGSVQAAVLAADADRQDGEAPGVPECPEHAAQETTEIRGC